MNPRRPGFSRRERTLVLSTVSIILAAALYAFILEPMFVNLGLVRQALQSASVELKKSRRQVASRKQIRELDQAVSQQVAMRGSEEATMAEFLSWVERQAQQASLPLKGLRPRAVSSKGKYRVLIVDLDAEGKIPEISRFLNSLTTATYPIRVERLQLSVKGAADKVLDTRLTLSSLRLPTEVPSDKKS